MSHEVATGSRPVANARHPRCYDREDMVFDPVHYPYLPRADVATTSVASYMSLLSGEAA